MTYSQKYSQNVNILIVKKRMNRLRILYGFASLNFSSNTNINNSKSTKFKYNRKKIIKLKIILLTISWMGMGLETCAMCDGQDGYRDQVPQHPIKT